MAWHIRPACPDYVPGDVRGINDNKLLEKEIDDISFISVRVDLMKDFVMYNNKCLLQSLF